MLGSSNPHATARSSSEADADAEPTEVAAGQTEATRRLAQQSDQDLGVDRVFARVLSDLLRAKKFQSQQGRRSTKYVLEWHDPIATPFPPDAARSEKWASVLGQFDCVVLLRDHADYDLDFIRQNAKQLVDARQHGFVAGVSQTAKEQQRPVQVTYTGVVPIVYKAQRTLLHSLIDSIFWAFVMIAAAMMVLLRTKRTQILNVRGGMVSMIPNVFPVILVFGAIGHMSRWNVVVDIGTMMTASVAMGVAVDDTIHFLTWFRRGIREGLERHDAIRNAYAHVAVAMTQTTLIGGLGLSVFALSTFTPTQRFGTMMLTLLVTALVGDLIILPALLAGPLGKYLCPQNAEPPAGKKKDQHPGSLSRASALDEADTASAQRDVVPLEQTAPLKGPTHQASRDSRSAPHVRRDPRH